MLFITGLMGLYSLCILIRALSIGAMGFICIMYFCRFLSITVLFIYCGLYILPPHRLIKKCNNNEFTPFYFTLDNFNVLKILLI
jgi:hypothetical protein